MIDFLTEQQLVREGFYVCLFCCIWNLLGDLVYTPLYASGQQILSKELPTLLHQTENSHELLLLAQTAGWMYPIWGFLTARQVHIGLKQAGFWWSTAPPWPTRFA